MPPAGPPPLRTARHAVAAGCAAAALALAGATATPAAAADPEPCAVTVAAPALQASPAAGAPCLVEPDPYPFGDDGNPVDPREPRCTRPDNVEAPCYLEVTSLAFRAWNRGLAATRRKGSRTPFGLWVYNGRRWYPDPTFPGTATCRGDTVLWAGKLDYWLVGPGDTLGWANLCRFDGSAFQWEPIRLPAATLARVEAGVDAAGQPIRDPGGITTGTCLAWNDCTFFGTHGAVVRWDGVRLTDASPDAERPWLWGEYRAAVARLGADGTPVGIAAGRTSRRADVRSPLPPAEPGAGPPPRLYRLAGGSWDPVAFAPPGVPGPTDPFRTDLVAADLDASGRGWVAGVPTTRPGAGPAPEPAPLLPVTPAGADPGCTAPPPDRFLGTPGPADSYRWTSLATVGDTGDALVGGRFRPAGEQSAPDEPVLVRATCAGAVTLTRFRTPDPVPGGDGRLVDARGGVAAVAVSAVNDGWVATTGGVYELLGAGFSAPPHLYRLSDGREPLAPAGDDREIRPVELQEDAPVLVFEPLPPEPAAAPEPPALTRTEAARPRLPAVYRIRARVVGRTLRVTFRVRELTRLGVSAIRRGRVVGTTGLRRFRPPGGRLTLRLNPRRWPTRFRLLTPARPPAKAPTTPGST